MTETEWLTCADQQKMVKFLFGKASDRKLRLLGAAFCRRVWRYLPEGPHREAIRVAERYADDEATDQERRKIREECSDPKSKRLAVINAVCAVRYLSEKTSGRYPFFVTGNGAIAHGASEKYKANRKKSFPIYRAALLAARRAEARLVRCVFGNPFRPVELDSEYLEQGDGSLRVLAEALYTKRRLPEGTFPPRQLAELADALENAGGTITEVLDHLRAPGPHVRGCWVIDLLLGKK